MATRRHCRNCPELAQPFPLPLSPMSEECEFHLADDAVVESVSSLLSRMCRINDVTRSCGLSGISMFHSVCPAPISVFDYLIRLIRKSGCSASCVLVALIYLDTAHHKAHITVDSLSVHRLMLTATMLAAKFYNDAVVKNSVFAQIGGVRAAELNKLEAELLRCLEYQLSVSSEKYISYEKALLKSHQNHSQGSHHFNSSHSFHNRCLSEPNSAGSSPFPSPSPSPRVPNRDGPSSSNSDPTAPRRLLPVRRMSAISDASSVLSVSTSHSAASSDSITAGLVPRGASLCNSPASISSQPITSYSGSIVSSQSHQSAFASSNGVNCSPLDTEFSKACQLSSAAAAPSPITAFSQSSSSSGSRFSLVHRLSLSNLSASPSLVACSSSRSDSIMEDQQLSDRDHDNSSAIFSFKRSIGVAVVPESAPNT